METTHDQLQAIATDLQFNSFIDHSTLERIRSDASGQRRFVLVVETRFLDIVNDNVSLYIMEHDGQLIVTDDGYTKFNFDCYTQGKLFPVAVELAKRMDSISLIHGNELINPYTGAESLTDMLTTILMLYGHLERIGNE